MPIQLEISNSRHSNPSLKQRLRLPAIACTAALSCSLFLVEAQATFVEAQTVSGQNLGIVTTPAFDARSAQTQSSQNQVALRAALPAESLGNNDLIEIMVPYCPELSHSFRVGTDGLLVLPLLHQEIKIAGLTPSQAGSRIRQALIAEQVMPDPVVSVSVLEYRSRPVSVVGAVVHPLTFQATGEITLLDAIAMAGGFVPGGATDVLISSRRFNAEGTIEVTVQTIPVRGLLLHASAASNVMLRGGEDIRVTEAGRVFVAGNVMKPGAYIMQGDEDTTVLKALALSSGLQQYSARVAYIYRRRAAGGDREEIMVPLSRIITRKEPDVSLVADDILYVPDNTGKRLAARVLSQIAGFGQSTATGLLIYR